MTGVATARPGTAGWAPTRGVDLSLARVHLRTGTLGLARAELEALAGSGDLDDEGLIDLAEARWRTGDLPGAGEAARAYLDGGGDAVLALAIAAEATAALGRPGEARTLAGRVLERASGSLDALFAGMPRSPIWPAETATVATAAAGEPPSVGEGPPAADDDDATRAAPAVTDLVPSQALDAGRAALADGRLVEAAVHLGLALRVSPEIAPAVVELLDGVDGPAAQLVLGDALRAVGREDDASRAWAAAAAAVQRGAPGEPRP